MSEKEDVIYLKKERDGVRLKVHLSPRSFNEGVGGIHGDALQIKVKAPPVKGRANEALIKLLARRLGVAKNKITIRSGNTSRTKILHIESLSITEAAARLHQG
ncbi:MAG: YggU family protein [Deltaproteobacteria bacterium]|nr:YggU family protein [Deltaproteobacteria bacterium]MBW2050879.1 YggU family protein [Deltaproteobacteria bacterium]MBW2141721.1 YggU family protein [Deltaproteobacteria bacterium]MBW2322878.1 YggU family protein [Deltaproteobacteria bacterium]